MESLPGAREEHEDAGRRGPGRLVNAPGLFREDLEGLCNLQILKS